MENNKQNNSQGAEVAELDLRRLVQPLLNKAWQIGLVTILCGIFAYVASVMLLTPKYEASALFYVNNSVSLGDASVSISNGDIVTSKSLVDSYIVILKSRATLMDVIDYADSNKTYEQLSGMISATDVGGTEIFRVTVTSPDPKEAEVLANAIAHVIPKRIGSIIEGSSAKVVDYAVLPKGPSYPNNVNNMMLGLLIGFALSAGFIILVEIFDVTIKDEEDLKNCCSYPILATVPDMNRSSKRGYGYYSRYYKKHAYYKRNNNVTEDATAEKSNSVVGNDINFAASEAYKLLRTKLQYSFANERSCRVFAVSSAMAGEGKSVSSVNLAYSLAQLDKRVLLIDCDMRRPTLAEKLSLIKYPGLSEHLTGFITLDEVLQVCDNSETAGQFQVITAGNTPPNPVELMNSARMSASLKQLRERFDYIILDMPPIGDVSDALISAKLADGVLLVVRQDYGSRVAVRDAIQQFEFVNAKILGVLLNCATDRTARYSKRSYGYGYRKGYGYGYGYGNRYGYRYGYHKPQAAEKADTNKQPRYAVKTDTNKQPKPAVKAKKK